MTIAAQVSLPRVLIWDTNAANPYAAEVARVLVGGVSRVTRYCRPESVRAGFDVRDCRWIPVSGTAATSIRGKVRYGSALVRFAFAAFVTRSVVVMPWVSSGADRVALLILAALTRRTVLVVHNPVHGRYREMNSALHRGLHRKVGVVVVHSAELQRQLGPNRRSAVVAHPSYIGWARQYASSAAERVAYGSRNTCGQYALYLGAPRPDKGIDYLEGLAECLKQSGLALRVAAGRVVPAILEDVTAWNNVEIVGDGTRYLTDDELANEILNAVAVVLPYTNVTASGTAMLAATLGIDIVGFENPFLLQLAGPEACVPVGDVHALAQRVAELVRVDRSPSSERISEVDLSARASWLSVIRSVV